MLPRLVSAALLASLAIPLTVSAQQPAFAIKAHLDLTTAVDGFKGSLELLEDARITPALDKALWRSGGPEIALNENDPFLKGLASSPLRPAVLRLLNARGKVVANVKLKREQARIEARQLHPGFRSILLTTDLSAGFGSYSGPLTQILDLSHRTIGFVSAIDPKTRASKPINLALTLKTEWRLDPVSAGPAVSKDILELSCRPDLNQAVDLSHPEGQRFFLFYTRYHWIGTEWTVAVRRTIGFWESEQPFPPANRFPQP